MKTKHNLLILGAGDFAKSMADAAQDTQLFNFIGFVIDIPPFERGTHLGGKPIFWIDQLKDFDKTPKVICGLGSMKRINIINKVLEMGLQFTNIIHPKAYVSRTVKLGAGVFINSGVQIATDVSISNHVIINRGALIGHGVNINEFSVISPGVNIAGNVTIGEKTVVGMGTNIIERVTIGNNCMIGAASLLTKDIPDHVKVVGIPARIIERDIDVP
jgi:sugar O-acyltransferase (sialic acid O-acetyltransferase NeuD family)